MTKANWQTLEVSLAYAMIPRLDLIRQLSIKCGGATQKQRDQTIYGMTKEREMNLVTSLLQLTDTE